MPAPEADPEALAAGRFFVFLPALLFLEAMYPVNGLWQPLSCNACEPSGSRATSCKDLLQLLGGKHDDGCTGRACRENHAGTGCRHHAAVGRAKNPAGSGTAIYTAMQACSLC